MSKAILITDKEVETIEFVGGLDWYYKMIDCDYIDIVNTYGMKSETSDYCMVVDDEALVKEDYKINALASIIYGCKIHGEIIAGKVLICKNQYTEDGLETVGLDDADVVEVYRKIREILGTRNS